MALKKKGMSEVVSSLLLILLTIASITIIVGVIVPFVKNNLGKTDCFKTRDYFKFDESFGFNCWDELNNRYLITVKANGDNSNAEKINGFNLRFLSEGDINNVVLEIKDGETLSGFNMIDTDIGGGNLIIPFSGGKYSVLTYNYTSSVIYKKVEIYPLIGKKVCDISDSINLVKCG